MSEAQIDHNPQSLNVAIATDTVLYAPFFMAYYGGDFNDTRFGKLSVNIIGKEEDNRFLSLKLKGDGFATFCVVFGLADVAICDPSFILFLKTCPPTTLEELCKTFLDGLTNYGKNSVHKKNPTVINSEHKLISADSLRKLISSEKNIIGGMISKLAISVVANHSIAGTRQNRIFQNVELFGSNPLKDETAQKFTGENIKQFIFYEYPSTGNCFGKIYADIYKKEAIEDSPHKDFGEEIVFLTKTTQKPSYAFSCDYVAIDYRKDFEETTDEKVIEIKDFTKSSDGFLFTGFVANTNEKNINKLKGFLYGVDKNLFEIDNYLQNEEITGLVNYIKSKLPREKDMLNSVLKMLVADKDCFKKINDKVKEEKDPFNLDNVITMFAKRLSEWQAFGRENNLGLYYTTTSVTTDVKDDLVNIYILRKKAFQNGDIPEEEIKSISSSIYTDLLDDWRNKEMAEIVELNRQAFNLQNQWRKQESALLNKEKSTKYFYHKKVFYKILKTPLCIFSKKITIEIRVLIWSMLSKPTFLYWIGVAFILFEILSGVAHLSHAYINDFPHIPIVYPTYSKENGFKLQHTEFNLNVIINIVIGYLTVVIAISVFMGYGLIRKKQLEKYVYKHE